MNTRQTHLTLDHVNALVAEADKAGGNDAC